MALQTASSMAVTLAVLMSLLSEPRCAGALDVLVLSPLHGASHEAQLRTLAEEMVRRGHQVTMVRFESGKQRKGHQMKEPANLTVISLSVPNEDGSVPFVTKGRQGRFQLPLERLWRLGLCPLQVPLSAFFTNDAVCKLLLPPKGRLRRRLRQYDVAVVDSFANECGLALASDLKAPTVTYWALPLSGGEGDYAAGVWKPPFMANTPSMMTKLTDNMTYLERLYSAFFRMGGHLVMSIQFWWTHLAIQRHLPGAPHPRRLLEDIAGVLENSDVALDYPRALPPNVINIGCMQCRPPRTLPQDLEEFVEGSGSAGIVVFSMGATIDAAVAPKAFLRRLLKVFSRLPQRILMKYDGNVKEEVPPNVKMMAWMPQQDLLGHRRCRAFFSHCGLHGAMESVYHGVPVVGMPIFGDQTDVAEMLVDKGMGIRLTKDASEEQILAALNEVIGNPRYRRNALSRREILLDNPQTPMERAVWFIEYIARHKGAPHLRIATRNYNSAQLSGIDVLLGLLFGAVLLLFSIDKLLRLVIRASAAALCKQHSTGEAIPRQKNETAADSIPLLSAWISNTVKLLRGVLTLKIIKDALSAVGEEASRRASRHGFKGEEIKGSQKEAPTKAAKSIHCE
ncbi:UDP-glycosyltransferase [Ladona fulva]|uniref:UDP-glycosyltransferase n=1 Tax=Ladona fulva TaxID=123851 RepID=A0A8K0KMP5_LADFU|nr:UDP-glycosyltransferase [Ladona fulva]